MTETIAQLNARLDRIRIDEAKARVRSQRSAATLGERAAKASPPHALTDEQLASAIVKRYREGADSKASKATAAIASAHVTMSAEECCAHEIVQLYLGSKQ